MKINKSFYKVLHQHTIYNWNQQIRKQIIYWTKLEALKFICAKPKKKATKQFREKKKQANSNTISFYIKNFLSISNCPILLVLVQFHLDHYYNLHHFGFVQSKFIMMIKLWTAKLNLEYIQVMYMFMTRTRLY